MAGIRLIAGLGNPGQQYAHSRHNAGADFVAALAATYGAELRPEARFQGLTGRCRIGDADVRLLVPTTFYNKSGDAVVPMLRYFRIEPAELLVVHDELDLPPGVARLKDGGGHGGSNGLQDIIRALGGERGFHRLRLGIGKPPPRQQGRDYVLNRAPAAEREAAAVAADEALRALPELVAGDWQKACTRLHTATRPAADADSAKGKD